MIHIVHLLYAIPVLWLIRRDTALRDGVSPALWIPTLWVGIISSKPLTMWLGFGGGSDSMEGSSVDALLFLLLIVAAVFTLSRRQVDWSQLGAKNIPLLVFYLFLLISIVWANSSFVSFKRWFKEFGNVFIILVILTEVNPLQATKAVFIRCAYFLIPLSVIYIRYFPNLGRRYSRSGGLEVIGVTNQKNTLGVMVLVCMLALLWDWFERMSKNQRMPFLERYLTPSMAILSFYVLHQSGSKTSMLCLLIGGFIISAIRFAPLRQRINRFGIYTFAFAIIFFWLDSYVGLSEWIVSLLGRDMTFTGRTNVWERLLNVGTNPIIGTGFMSFWDDYSFRSRLPYWVSGSAHNGYIEIYLAGGYIGLIMLAQLLINTAFRLNRALAEGGNYAVVRFSIFVVALIANFSESNFACMTPIGLLLTLAIIGTVPRSGIPSPRIAEPRSAAPTPSTARARTYRPSPRPFDGRQLKGNRGGS